jgi:hypothetical protein
MQSGHAFWLFALIKGAEMGAELPWVAAVLLHVSLTVVAKRDWGAVAHAQQLLWQQLPELS